MADEHSEYSVYTSFTNNQAIHWPSSNAFQLETIAAPRWPHSAFDTSLATAGSNHTPLNLEYHGYPVEIPFAGIQNDGILTHIPLDDARNSMTTSTPRSNAYATGKDWTKHRPSIKKLYVDEKKTLADVMHIMESRHGFKATKKMYKSRITQWNLSKKNKENEMRAIARKRKLRRDQGKLSSFRVRGRSVDSDEEVRYWRRKGVTVDDVIAQRTMSRTPESVQVSTRIHSPVLTSAEPAISEQLFRSIQDYIAGSFDARTWVTIGPFSRCYSTKTNWPTDGLRISFSCIEACRLFSKDHFQKGGQILLAATAGLKNKLLAEDPYMLFEMCMTMFHMHRWRRDEIATAILRQIYGLSEIVLADEHPLRRIWAWLLSVASSQYEDLIYRCIQIMADQFESCIGSMHISTMNCRLNLAIIMRDLGPTGQDMCCCIYQPE
ncbi:hypothetical protein N7G274_000710 [Stereocaulon virgatum]|uniref:Clr5 domain-containing protein n=1 Tax=Stereocaulon virgatum TaxID=373712 RepID=A0ABR4APK2_9LECA